LAQPYSVFVNYWPPFGALLQGHKTQTERLKTNAEQTQTQTQNHLLLPRSRPHRHTIFITAAPPHHLHHRRAAAPPRRRTTALSCLPFILFHTQNHNSSNPSEFFPFSVHR
jgi:hypothetical protein